MKTFTKFCLLALVLFFTTSLIAQQSFQNHTGNTAPDQQEMIKQLHGPTVHAPASPDGGKAIGDDCNNPIIVEYAALPFSDPGQTTTGRLDSYSSTCLNDFDEGEDIVYQLNITEDITLKFELDPKGTAYTGMALSEECGWDGTCLAISTDISNGGASPLIMTAVLEAGTYYLIIDLWGGVKATSIADFDLDIAETSVVPNDECVDAIEVGLLNQQYYSNEDASASLPDSRVDVWYKYTASFNGTLAVDVCDSDFDTYLSLYDGCSGTMLEENDNACGYAGLQSSLTYAVTDGTTYWIRVAGATSGDVGSGYLNLYKNPSACSLTNGTPESEGNGDCDNAETVASGDTILGNLWADGNLRDTDWYELNLASISSVKLAVIAEGPTTFGLVYQYELGNGDCDNLGNTFTEYKIIPTCVEDSIEFMNLPAGTYYFVVATAAYNGYVTGFAYEAAFTVVADTTGTISGVVDDGATGIEGVTVSTDIFSTTTIADGSYSLTVPVGTYDVTANGFAVGYSTKVVADTAVTYNGTTTVDFELNNAKPTLSAGADVDFGKINLSWTAVPVKGNNGTDVVMGGVESNNNYTAGTTMDIEFTLTVHSPNADNYGEYFEITLPAGLVPNSASDFTNVDGGVNAATVDVQKVYWGTEAYGNEFWKDTELVDFDFTVNVTVAGGTTGPQVCDYLFIGDPTTSSWTFDGLVTVFEEGGAYVPTYNVYRKLDNGVGYEFIPLVTSIPDMELFDVIDLAGTTVVGDWCYIVSQNLDDGTESAPSDVVCVELKDPCDDAIDYGNPGDAAQKDTLGYKEQVMWYKLVLPTDMAIDISTCESDFDTQFALYESCGDIPVYPEMVPAGAIDTVTDGCIVAGQASEGYCALDAGTYYIAVYGENDEFGIIDLNITQVQCLTIYDGWSGFSTYMDSAPDTLIEDVLDEMADEMIITIRQSPYGIWWPFANINTIQNISPEKGYKSKMTAMETTVIMGTEVANKTVALPKGASYLPVKVPYSVNINHLSTALGNDLVIIYNIYTNEVYWPEGGIVDDLTDLEPGFAYLINMSAASSFTYPAFLAKSDADSKPITPFKGQNVAWNEVVNTGNPHIISIMRAAMDEVQVGDLIGVFNTEGTCVGITEVENKDGNIQLTAFGNDTYTEELDGLEENEGMIFKLYRSSNEEEYALEATFNTSAPNSDGTYATNGLSMISNLKVGATDISENELAKVSIYPNPSTGLLNIAGLETYAVITISNVQGQVIYSGEVSENGTLDLSSQAKGVYMIKLTNEHSTMIKKIILK